MKFKKILSSLLVVIIFGFIARNIIENWSVIKYFPWHFSYYNLSLLLIFLIPVYLTNSTSWFLVLRALDMKKKYLTIIRIWCFSNASRFIPGAIWQYGGRIFLSSKEGIPVALTVTSLMIEMIFVLTIGLLIVLTTFSLYHFSLNSYLYIVIFSLPILLFLLLIFTNQKILNIFFNFYKMVTGEKLGIKSFKLSPFWIAILSISFLIQFIFDGSVLFFLTRQAVDLSWNLYPVFIGIFASSWILGYITMIAPAGLGVQEISIATMLSLYMPFPVAGMVAILFRLVLLLSEILTILFLSVISKRLFKLKLI